MSEELLSQFWNLTKSDYKLEIFKILNDCEYYLGQPQIEFLFQQITQTPAVKLGIEEFDILAMLGRRCKTADFSSQVSDYFWQIIKDSEAYNQEALDCCVTKFAEMIKFKAIETKKPFFEHLTVFMAESTAPTIPVLRLFQKVVSDHKEKETVASRSNIGSGSTNINYGNVPKWVSTTSTDPVECRKVFDEIEQSSSFSQLILKNLAAYFNQLQGSCRCC